jgi:hypothetical protein
VQFSTDAHPLGGLSMVIVSPATGPLPQSQEYVGTQTLEAEAFNVSEPDVGISYEPVGETVICGGEVGVSTTTKLALARAAPD